MTDCWTDSLASYGCITYFTYQYVSQHHNTKTDSKTYLSILSSDKNSSNLKNSQICAMLVAIHHSNTPNSTTLQTVKYTSHSRGSHFIFLRLPTHCTIHGYGLGNEFWPFTGVLWLKTLCLLVDIYLHTLKCNSRHSQSFLM